MIPCEVCGEQFPTAIKVITDDEIFIYMRSLSLDFTQKINWQETVKLFYNEN